MFDRVMNTFLRSQTLFLCFLNGFDLSWEMPGGIKNVFKADFHQGSLPWKLTTRLKEHGGFSF